jgi:Transcriptional regulators of sugar metabolism
MNSSERQNIILKHLQEKESVRVDELTKEFGVSKVTIRTDLDSLEQKGLLVRTHGGAMASEKQSFVRLITNTINESPNEKDLICREAARLIESGDTIILDNGSTTVHLATYIRNKNLTVATGSLLAMERLADDASVELIMLGGILRRYSMGAIGPMVKNCLQQFHSRWLFMGASGMSVEGGITCTNLIEAETKQAMLKSADLVCLLADSSKMGKVSFAKVCQWDEIDYLITDKIDEKSKKAIEEMGVEVIIAR